MKTGLSTVLALVAGAMAAAAYAMIGGETVSASEGVTWYSNPGPSNSTANLNCGWHEVCASTGPGDLPDNGGSALDWASSDYAAVSFRGWGYRTTSSLPLLMGTVYVGQRDGNCYNTAADIVNSYGTYMGRVNYTRSYRNVAEGYSFNIYGRSTGNYQSVAIAYSYPYLTERSDKPNCKTDGTHLHQFNNYATWTKGSYPNDDCWCSKGSQGDITANNKYMYYLSWNS